ncbi:MULTISPECIES: hypothetical protein [unclassified Crossiella]|uniref:hypothetical protein n=1 Tax=unclassified Crossiella TaxID=2620835 RepID=UPI001FFEAA98|nr:MULTISPECIES: hypothetical protein [unclassified Crossiella]MCK2241223.1 hypothetical protein [Crossiella sp. S99.2]MCK2253633.1 hypothetical protein [Crossiella sp. S99.1]
MNDRPQQTQQGENHDIASTTDIEKCVEKRARQAYHETARARGPLKFRVTITYIGGAEGERIRQELAMWLRQALILIAEHKKQSEQKGERS